MFCRLIKQPYLAYINRGAVAQLGERRVRNAKVGSSILLGSTKFNKIHKLLYILFLNLIEPSRLFFPNLTSLSISSFYLIYK